MDYLNEAAAWLEIAGRIEGGDWHREGLCREVETLEVAHKITVATEGAMYDRINTYCINTARSTRLVGSYLYTPGNAQPRIKLAREFAVAAEQDAKLMAEPEDSGLSYEEIIGTADATGVQ